MSVSKSFVVRIWNHNSFVFGEILYAYDELFCTILILFYSMLWVLTDSLLGFSLI